jgi:hypothetical protein
VFGFDWNRKDEAINGDFSSFGYGFGEILG